MRALNLGILLAAASHGFVVGCADEASRSADARSQDSGAAGASQAGASAGTQPPLADFDRELRVSELEDHDPAPNVVDVSLVARKAKLEVLPGTKTELWTYEGQEPGPLLRAKVGDRVIVRFENALDEPTTIHWHGLEVPAAMDGAEVSQPPVMPGEHFTYEFVVERAGLYWYHPHMNSAEQVFRGLYGPLLVEDPAQPAYGHEVVLVLDDLDVAKDGTLGSPDSSDNFGDYFGREGDTLLVNGRVQPTLYARSGEALRLRIVNTSTSHFFMLNVAGHPLLRIGGDSELSSHLEARSELLLVPGERADVVLIPDGEPGEELELKDLGYDRFGCEPEGKCATAPATLMRIALVEQAAQAARLPELHTELPKLDTAGIEDESIVLGETGTSGLAQLTINGQVFAPADGHMHHEPLLQARVGSTHVYRVENSTAHDHPFHLHGFRFRVLDRDGVVPGVDEWKDTLDIPGHTSARIAVHFDDRPGDWMFHCHILDHAKLGMMGVLRVSAD